MSAVRADFTFLFLQRGMEVIASRGSSMLFPLNCFILRRLNKQSPDTLEQLMKVTLGMREFKSFLNKQSPDTLEQLHQG